MHGSETTNILMGFKKLFDSSKQDKIMLVFPPGKVYVYPDGTPASRKTCSPPIGIAYLAANLLKHGYKVSCLDMSVENYEREVLSGSFVYYGLNTEELLERVREKDPDIIGFSILFSMLASDVLQMCAAVKEAFPDKHILLGGQHPTGAPYEVMKTPSVDFVLLGEADESIIQLMDALNGLQQLESVHSLVFRRQDGSICNTQDGVKAEHEGDGWKYYSRRNSGVPKKINDLTFPAWHLFNMEGYFSMSVRNGGGDAIADRYAVMITSRGCPHVCSFCTSPLSGGYRAYRTREIESVLEEIRWLVDMYGVGEIQFVEDNFFVNKKRTKKLMRALAEEFPEIVFWNTGGVEVNAMDKEMIGLMAKANFHRAILAIEAGDEEVQDSSVDKKVKLDRLPEVVGHLRKNNIDIKALYMIGFPGETRAQIDKTVELAKSLGVLDFHLSIVTPLPGTPLWDQCVKEDLFLDGRTINDINFGQAGIKLPDTSPEELEFIRRSVWQEAFEKRRSMNEQAVTLKKFGVAKKAMQAHKTHEEYQGFTTRK